MPNGPFILLPRRKFFWTINNIRNQIKGSTNIINDSAGLERDERTPFLKPFLDEDDILLQEGDEPLELDVGTDLILGSQKLQPPSELAVAARRTDIAAVTVVLPRRLGLGTLRLNLCGSRNEENLLDLMLAAEVELVLNLNGATLV